MKVYYFLLNFLFFATSIKSSELLKQLWHPTDRLIQEKLDNTFQQFQDNLNAVPSWGFEEMYIHNDYHRKVSIIALNAGVGMCDQEKLQWITGDGYYKKRKEIVCAIVQSMHNAGEKQFNPCCLRYQGTDPLSESIAHSDVTFAEYLLQNGAQLDERILEAVQESSSDELKKLFASFYNQK